MAVMRGNNDKDGATGSLRQYEVPSKPRRWPRMGRISNENGWRFAANRPGNGDHRVIRALEVSLTKPSTVVLEGNPNTGKATLFNALGSARLHLGSFPSITAEDLEGRL